ncbi:pyrroline-5-carboxylate reductase [Chloroflexota bacterium]
MKMSFIGGGNMGRAMLSAIIGKGLTTSENITVSDKNNARLQQLKEDFSVNISSNLDIIAGGEIIILAIKPQNLDEVMTEVSGRLKPDQLVLSIIAGKSIASLRQGLKHNAIVRAMPNTPAQIGQGMTVWTATDEVTEKRRASVGSILGAMGKEVYVTDEGYIDMATAVSGSGPAYIFLFMESLINAAVGLGLPPETARELVLQTVTGSAEYASQSDKGLAQLREMVTSPGGTTAEAIKTLETGMFAELVKKAIATAYRRAKELEG